MRDRVEEACQAIAGFIIGDVLSREGAYDWGDYPEIGEHDWDRITALIRNAAVNSSPDAHRLNAATVLLTARAGECICLTPDWQGEGAYSGILPDCPQHGDPNVLRQLKTPPR